MQNANTNYTQIWYGELKITDLWLGSTMWNTPFTCNKVWINLFNMTAVEEIDGRARGYSFSWNKRIHITGKTE